MAIAGRVAIRPRGAYDATVAYERLDMVKYQNTLFIAKKAVSGVTPVEGENWMDCGGTDLSNIEKKLAALENPEFTEAEELAALTSKESHTTLWGKVAKAVSSIITHIGNKNNPHEVTANQVGALTEDNIANSTVVTESGFAADARQLNKEVEDSFAAGLEEEISLLNQGLTNISHNIPRLVPKDITSYYQDGSLWDRLNGTNGYTLFEDIFVGDYIEMSRPISAYNQDQTYQTTGSQYVTIAGINTLLGNGNTAVNYNHLVMVPGKGFGGTQHFGRSRMNPTNTTVGGYVATEMHTTTIGAVVTEGSTETTATINQQLYAEFGSHLKTTRELLSNSLNSTGYNRFGSNTGCSNNWAWTDCQAVLMSEIEVFGSIVWSSSGYDTGTAKVQLPLFANNKYAVNNRNAWYWLKDIASADVFCLCNSNGGAYCDSASNADYYVRPRFVIAA